MRTKLAAAAAIALVGLAAAVPAARAGDDEKEPAAAPVEVEQRVLDWLRHVFTGETEKARATSALPFAAGKRYPDDGDRLEVQVVTEEAVLEKMLAGAKAPHKLKAFTRVDASEKVTKAEAAKVAEIGKVLPEGGQRVVVGDASGLNPDLLEIWLRPDGKVAAVIEIER